MKQTWKNGNRKAFWFRTLAVYCCQCNTSFLKSYFQAAVLQLLIRTNHLLLLPSIVQHICPEAIFHLYWPYQCVYSTDNCLIGFQSTDSAKHCILYMKAQRSGLFLTGFYMDLVRCICDTCRWVHWVHMSGLKTLFFTANHRYGIAT